MIVVTLEIEEIKKLMQRDINSDEAFIKISSGFPRRTDEYSDDSGAPSSVYLGPFPLYE